jgi:hypothetical protein
VSDRPTVTEVIAEALRAAPEQGDWPFHDHCDGVAAFVRQALKDNGYLIFHHVDESEVDAW